MPVPERFVELVQGPEADLALDEACLLIAVALMGDVDVAATSAELDELAAEVRHASVDSLLEHLFGRAGFRGDHEHYDDPANSLLNLVVERRTGIPITLSVLTMEVGRRAGVALHGIGLPGHFLVRDAGDADSFIDPFSGGVRLDRAAVERLFVTLHGPDIAFRDAYLEPTGPRAIVSRILANLLRSFRTRRDRRSLAVVLQLRVAVPGSSPAERRELAGALAALGRFDLGATELEALAAHLGSTEEAGRIRTDAVRMRARLN